MTTTMTTASSVPGTVTRDAPLWWTQNLENLTNTAGGFAGPRGQIEQTYDNWYSDSNPLTAPWNTNLNTAYDTTNTGAAWSPTINSAIDDTGNAATWNASTQQQFMNPYLSNVVEEMMRLSNQNFNETIMPGVNTTFAGANQFGSTRNADFINRAIRDQQQQLTGNIGNQLFKAQDAAGAQYSDWANKGLTAANQQGALATAGAALGQQDWQNALEAGKTRNTWEQGQYDRSKADWLEQSKYPMEQYGALSKIFSNLQGGVPASTTTEAAEGLTDLQKMEALVGILGIPGMDAGDTTLGGDIWEWLQGIFSGTDTPTA